MIAKEDFWKTINDVHSNIAMNSIESIRKLSKVIPSIAFQMLPDKLCKSIIIRVYTVDEAEYFPSSLDVSTRCLALQPEKSCSSCRDSMISKLYFSLLTVC